MLMVLLPMNLLIHIYSSDVADAISTLNVVA